MSLFVTEEDRKFMFTLYSNLPKRFQTNQVIITIVYSSFYYKVDFTYYQLDHAIS